MGLDIRLPIGLMFSLLGSVLAAFGLWSDRTIYARSLGYNVNLWWGLVLLAFGLVFIYFGRRGTRALRSAAHSAAMTSPASVEERTPVPHGQ
ncbi:MAG: hypothetical protein HY561_00745 [Gemmatimonadetes bacterium]|nr:hypothetical protein [Gemmatimonadota bacterium]